MGKVYYDMGFLATAEVVECSATALVGQYVGQTGPKTQKLLEKALGKVLFIDEAYRLAKGQFAKEAVDELVDSLTKPKFAQKLVTILAGYDVDINRLVSINPGLTSRFPEAVIFKPLSSQKCLELFTQILRQKKHLDIAILEQPSNELCGRLLQRFEALSSLANWANARDIQTLVKAVFGKIMKSATPSQQKLTVNEETIFEEIESMISERAHRSQHATLDQGIPFSNPLQAVSHDFIQTPPTINAPAFSYANLQSDHLPSVNPDAQAMTDEIPRDKGVSDTIWECLQKDKLVAEARMLEHKRLFEEERVLKELDAASRERELAVETTLKEMVRDNGDTAAVEEAKRLHEETRLRNELERRAHEAKLEELERKRKAAEEEQRKEAKAQAALRRMGVCSAGYKWIKQTSGYRCAGGSHYVSDAELGLG